MNERTCIVTRQNASAQTLIRFVIGPNNQIVPDLKANLPGRGVWISAHHAVIDKAIKQKAFHKILKQMLRLHQILCILLIRFYSKLLFQAFPWQEKQELLL